MSSHKANPIQYSDQEVLNESFNDIYKILEVAPYGYDSASDSFKPMNADIAWDYLGYTNTSNTIDTYAFKTGGSGGTTVRTMTVTYTDSSKSQISSIAKT